VRSRLAIPIASLLGALLALGAAACSPPAAPDSPTYANDVQPIVFARCFRCHGAGGNLNMDPKAADTAEAIGFIGQYQDNTTLCGPPNDAGAVSLTCQGAASLAKTMAARVALGDNDILRMPPQPSARLSDRQIEIITRWAEVVPPAP
jgi:hypothetical protein